MSLSSLNLHTEESRGKRKHFTWQQRLQFNSLASHFACVKNKTKQHEHGYQWYYLVFLFFVVPVQSVWKCEKVSKNISTKMRQSPANTIFFKVKTLSRQFLKDMCYSKTQMSTLNWLKTSQHCGKSHGQLHIWRETPPQRATRRFSLTQNASLNCNAIFGQKQLRLYDNPLDLKSL